MILLDTDHFSVLTDSRHRQHAQLLDKLERVSDDVLIPVVSVEEQLRAWLAQIHRTRNSREQIYPYDRLLRLLETLGEWEVARWTDDAADQLEQLRRARIRIGTQDLKIASIALANDATLLSANLRDFHRIPWNQKVSGTDCRNGPPGAAHNRFLTPFGATQDAC
ncbi:MAG: type II toxin-antitoxin system VapC family toxin [Planctomycetes bacterium]|nr:type II toxin-antitoxin system VapC family toxin [Planctomycetota bacterium]